MITVSEVRSTAAFNATSYSIFYVGSVTPRISRILECTIRKFDLLFCAIALQCLDSAYLMQ